MYTIVLRKKLDTVSRKDLEVGAWKQSVINHMYWVAASTTDDHPDIKEAKWVSLCEHVRNEHENCFHDDLEEDERRDKIWLRHRKYNFASTPYNFI